jgi:hypothetical protein
VETYIVEATKAECGAEGIYFTRLSDNKLVLVETRVTSPVASMIVGRRLGGVGALLPGDYIVSQVSCATGRTHIVRGPHARIRIRSGEIVNIGMFKMIMHHEHEGFTLNPFEKTFAHRAIEPLSPQAVAFFKETYPYTFARAISRPMTLIGPPDGELK